MDSRVGSTPQKSKQAINFAIFVICTFLSQTCADSAIVQIPGFVQGKNSKKSLESAEKQVQPTANENPEIPQDKDNETPSVATSSVKNTRPDGKPIQIENSDTPNLAEQPSLTPRGGTTVQSTPDSTSQTAAASAAPINFPNKPDVFKKISDTAFSTIPNSELKGLAVFGETWNIKKADVIASTTNLRVSGTLSHHVPFYKGLIDDQIRYQFTFKVNGLVDANLTNTNTSDILDNSTISLVLSDIDTAKGLTYGELPQVFDAIYTMPSMPRWEDGAQLIGLYIAIDAYRDWIKPKTANP